MAAVIPLAVAELAWILVQDVISQPASRFIDYL